MAATSFEYRGALRAAILDWAGTTVDYGSRAPAVAFTRLFQRYGVALTAEQVRRPMGMHKKDHIQAIALHDDVAARWVAVHGRPPSPADVDRLYKEFVPLQIEVLAEHHDLIPGVVEAVAALRRRGLKIGGTTGYTATMMEPLAREASRQGYQPDVSVTADQVTEGRPAPWMCFLATMRLGVYPMEACVKAGDTPVDITEGRNAGMWTIGVTRTGNELGLAPSEAAALPPTELTCRLRAATEHLLGCGAHYVVESVADLPGIVDEINGRLSRGERP